MFKRKKQERQGKPVEAESLKLPIQPNMMLANVSATSSTFDHVDLDHCVFNRTNCFNSLFAVNNMEGTTFNLCNLSGAVIENSSLRDVQINNCIVDGLIINGVDIGKLFSRLEQSLGGKNG